MGAVVAKSRRSADLSRPRARRDGSRAGGGNGSGEGQRSHVVTDPALVLASMRANGFAKRLFDMFAAFCGLVVLAPVFLAVAILISLNDGGPTFYGHRRVGRQGRMFKCWKFRSMVKDGDAVLAAHLKDNPAAEREWRETQKLDDDPRVTAIGAFIRKTSIDELPQLWNVLVGEMSLVGPRPITRTELDRYGKDRRYYLLVRPGITGLWQVSGRSTTTYERRIAYDRNYLVNWSYSQDAMILWRTVPAVLKSEGAK
jgi:exopolysaccharide production protein ExoY